MIVPSVAATVISTGIRALIAADYGKFYDRSTWIFNGTALLVSFGMKAWVGWSSKDPHSPVRNRERDYKREFTIMTGSQVLGYFVADVALSILGRSISREEALPYTLVAGGFADLIVILNK